MSALRSLLRLAGATGAAYEAAGATAADAVLVDLDADAAPGARARARRALRRHRGALAEAGRPLLARVADARSGELEADLDAAVSEATAAVVLAACEEPQDARDADVAIRRLEMRRGLVPGQVRLLCEIDSAAGLAALPAVLAAVDRHGAVAVAPLAVVSEIGATPPPAGAAPASRAASWALLDHLMAQTALTAGTAGLPWIVDAPGVAPGLRQALGARARDLGASGCVVASEAEARGVNTLFEPDPARLRDARAVIGEWERMRAAGRWSDEVGGHRIDRRRVRRARRTARGEGHLQA
ncbi:MAG: hypothetical protein F4150_09415 [Chloroflexi bacterium]|nr:hypothetical protein [Chloroflexota bacterium]